ncbi:MAG: PD40 domain-containing protein [Fimbriimonadaceae bacterium]|nr:PD40 domain-containing protein [Fimbriimonadaceae bacterium]
MTTRRSGYLLTGLVLLTLLAACGGGLGLFQEPSPGNVPPDRLALISGGGGQYLVPVRIGNQTFRLLLDTGFQAVLVFADLVRADNTEVVRTGERANLQFGSGPRRGEIASAPIAVGQRSGTARLLLVDNPTSSDDPSLTWKGADGILGLRFQPGATDLGSARLDPPLLALAPRIRSMEFDLQPGGATLVLGGTPVLGSANPAAVFTAQTTTELRNDRIRENYADLEVPFQISSSRGVANAEDLDILLDTGAASLLVLDEPLAAQLGYDRGSQSWTIPADELLDLRLLGLAGQMPITPPFQVRDVRVADLGNTTFDAVLGLDRWQQYVVAFDFIDFSLGGPEGTFRFLRHDQIGAATGGCQRPDRHFVALRGLNSSGEDGSPALSADGRVIVFETDRHGGRGLRDIACYDRQAQALVDIGSINSESNDETPAVSGDGNLIAFTSDRPGGQGDFDIYLFDVAAGSFIDLPGLNTTALERSPGLSADGRFVSFRSERDASDSPSDVYLYDRQTAALVATPGLNSAADEFTSALSRHGERLVFEALNRPGDAGGVDVHLYDVTAGALVPLSAAVNSNRFDAFVNLSANGRWMTCFSERAAATPGAAGRDILLVDLGRNGTDGRPGVLVDLPGLNSAYEESSSSLNDDGTLIAFASSRCGGSGGLDIYLYQRD